MTDDDPTLGGLLGPEPARPFLTTWCGRYTPHGPHDTCLGWGDGRVGTEPEETP